jgi:hypothetical protein
VKHPAQFSLLVALALLPACHKLSSSGSGDTDAGADADTDTDTDADTDSGTETGSCVPDMTDLAFDMECIGGYEFVPGRGYHLADGVFTVSDWGTELCGVELEDAPLEELMDAAAAAVMGGMDDDIPYCGFDVYIYVLEIDMPPCYGEAHWCAEYPEDLSLQLQDFVELVEEIGDEIALGC